ncbi:MAG: radical SAM protein [Rhodospirillaceae bacterium]|nr:radical SAM protein [Rhodospirillaceae bacterium]
MIAPLPLATTEPTKPIIPRRVVIETMFGCNATCGMCVINHPTRRKKGHMPMESYRQLLEHLAPHCDTIEKFDLFGLGEPLLDPYLAERIRLAKAMGFRNTAISTNAHLLDAKRRNDLLNAGLDTVICSIDGATKATHEAIRTRTNFERVVNNVVAMVRERDAGDFSTRFVIRFIRQPANITEWDAYRTFWGGIVSASRRDLILAYDIHDWSGQVKGRATPMALADTALDSAPCHHIFEKLVILADGSVALCFEDILEAQFGFGNAFENDPIAIFNAPRFRKVRDLHLAGKRKSLNICKDCKVLQNETLQTEG